MFAAVVLVLGIKAVVTGTIHERGMGLLTGDQAMFYGTILIVGGALLLLKAIFTRAAASPHGASISVSSKYDAFELEAEPEAAPFPSSREKPDGYGFEYKSDATFFGLPLVHVSLKYRRNRVPVVAKGIVAIGQFACGVVTISQFGLGILSVSQFTVAGFALAQIGIAYSLIAQFGLYFHDGRGQVVRSILGLLGR